MPSLSTSPSVDPAFLRQLEGLRLTTAEIVYRMPDYQLLLQSYIWQDYDEAPHFPALKRFLTFWTRSLDGPLHTVRVTSSALVGTREIAIARDIAHLH